MPVRLILTGIVSFKEHFKQFSVSFTVVRLIAHRQIDPKLFVYNALVMRKGVEACFAVISTHSALPYSAKSHFAGGKMDYGIIYASAAKGNCFGYFSYAVFIP